jgi:hypothetical protein
MLLAGSRMQLALLLLGLVPVLMLGSLAAAAVARRGYGRPDTVAIGVLGAVVASAAHFASSIVALLDESIPYAAPCALAGLYTC